MKGNGRDKSEQKTAAQLRVEYINQHTQKSSQICEKFIIITKHCGKECNLQVHNIRFKLQIKGF